MKSLKILFSVLLVSVFVSSCSSDSDNSTKVKYQINGIDNAITEIKYKKGNGSMITVTDFEDFAGGGDSKTTSISNFPFTADLEVTVNNTTGATKNYDLVIYVDGEPQALTGFSAPPGVTSTGTVDFVVESE